MKEYPSITKDLFEFKAYVFDKLDGSNCRVEYSPKQGWYKFGKRHSLLDANDPLLGGAISVFHKDWNEKLTKVAKDEKWSNAILFFEYYGLSSFAGWHSTEEPKQLRLFDAALNKQGILGPKEFLDVFGDMEIAKFLGMHKWTTGFTDKVKNNELEGVTFEGVVGKAKFGKHELIMRKAKTANWINKVHAIHKPEDAMKIINS